MNFFIVMYASGSGNTRYFGGASLTGFPWSTLHVRLFNLFSGE
jgi:hypothetical protein